VHTVMNLWVPKIQGITWAAVSSSRGILQLVGWSKYPQADECGCAAHIQYVCRYRYIFLISECLSQTT
jgi:hypothetical protein